MNVQPLALKLATKYEKLEFIYSFMLLSSLPSYTSYSREKVWMKKPRLKPLKNIIPLLYNYVMFQMLGFSRKEKQAKFIYSCSLLKLQDSHVSTEYIREGWWGR